jgi:hypothetical protein
MESFAIFVAFFLGGAIFGGWLPAQKFMILAVVVTVLYFAGLASAAPHVGSLIAKGVGAFVCIQLGYVAGLGLATVLRDLLQKTQTRLPAKTLDTSKKTTE